MNDAGVDSARAPSREFKVLFIMGAGRSGTTILGNVLGQVPDFFHAGELQRLWALLERDIPCGCGAPVGRCPFWRSVLSAALDAPETSGLTVEAIGRLRSDAVRLRRLPRLLGQGNPRATRWPSLERLLAVSLTLYATVARLAEARVVIDSSKSVSDAAMLALLPTVDSYFVQLVRDPRAVAYSWERQRQQRPGWGRTPTHWTAGRVARNWVLGQCASEALRRRGDSSRWMSVRYEDFTRDPEAVVQTVLELIREPSAPTPFLTERTVSLRPNHTAGGNGNRFRSGVVRLESDDEWVSRQGVRDRLVATGVTLPLLIRHGYSLRPGSNARAHDPHGAPEHVRRA